ncbi:MAG: hypothetical protein ACR2RA_01545 [Geminicoccaceae bacterium]
MVIRSLVASTIMASYLAAGAAEAQVLLCPETPPADVATSDVPSAAERLLRRLVIALDLHGHRGISEQAIMQAHEKTPSALLAKLSNVVDRCMMASGDLDLFHAALPDLRKAFLEAADVAVNDGHIEGNRSIKNAALDAPEAERLEQSIDLSVRELWRKLWFRPADNVENPDDRWAVIVASPPDADSGWDQLGAHQRRWVDTYFQLHEPYYGSNPHHAVVVGRRLPQKQAARLLDYVIELGMAEDAFLWPLPEGGDLAGAGKTVFPVETLDADSPEKDRIDLSGLDG